MVHSFVLIATVTVVLNILVFVGLPLMIRLLQVPQQIVPYMEDYLRVIFMGIVAAFLYHYFADVVGVTNYFRHKGEIQRELGSETYICRQEKEI